MEQPLARGGEQDTVIVCADGDEVLHAPSPAGQCAAGQRRISLLRDDDGCPLCEPENKPGESSDDPAIRDLERRVHALEHAPYFEVVDNDDRPVFVVSRDGVRLFDKAGVPRVAFGSSAGGGYLTVTDGLTQASITATATGGGLQFVEDGLTRLIASGTDSGGASLRVPAGNGLIAGLGVSKDGPGTVLIGNLSGQVKATLSIPNDRPLLQVTGSNGAQASLMEQANGGGMLQLDSNEGAIVKMGNSNNEFGIVLAGPRPGPPLVPKSGLPGGFFMGCRGDQRPACTPITP